MSETFDYIIYSDGSANSSDHGAAACIVEDTNTLKRYFLVTSFGQSTNNQAEVFSTLLGYAFIESLGATPWDSRIKLVSDSEYTISSSVNYINKWKRSGKLYGNYIPLKNRYFWQLFDKLTNNFDILGEHVKGHSGHFDNERCDTAASWARIKRIESGPEEPYLIEIIKNKRKTTSFRDDWYYFDSTDLFSELTTEESTVDIVGIKNALIESLKAYKDDEDLNLVTTQDRALKCIMDKIKEAVTMANKYRSSDDRISNIESKLLDVIQEYKDEYY